MRPSKETLEEFMHLYEAEFHESIAEDEAAAMWTRVMDLYLLLYRQPARDEQRSATETEGRLS